MYCVGIILPSTNTTVTSALQLINSIKRQLEAFDKEILSIMEKLHSPIESIPGISTFCAATIIG